MSDTSEKRFMQVESRIDKGEMKQISHEEVCALRYEAIKEAQENTRRTLEKLENKLDAKFEALAEKTNFGTGGLKTLAWIVMAIIALAGVLSKFMG